MRSQIMSVRMKRKETIAFLYLWPRERMGFGDYDFGRHPPAIDRQMLIIDETWGELGFTYKPCTFLICDDGGDLEKKREIFEEMINEAKRKEAVVFVASHDRLSAAEHDFAREQRVKIESPDEPACRLVYSKNEEGISQNGKPI